MLCQNIIEVTCARCSCNLCYFFLDNGKKFWPLLQSMLLYYVFMISLVILLMMWDQFTQKLFYLYTHTTHQRYLLLFPYFEIYFHVCPCFFNYTIAPSFEKQWHICTLSEKRDIPLEKMYQIDSQRLNISEQPCKLPNKLTLLYLIFQLVQTKLIRFNGASVTK